MAVDSEIFKKDVKVKKGKVGRPTINRDLVRRLLEADKWSTKQIAKRAVCSVKSVQRERAKLVKAGTLQKMRTADNIVEADFDEECKTATGIYFSDFMKNKRKGKTWRTPFNFCRKTWEQIWKRPSLVRVTDPDDQLGDQLAMQYLSVFGDDKERIRRRLKLIRPLFTFLRREDINNRYLTMRKSKHPIPVKEVPEIAYPDFPAKLDAAIREFGKIHGEAAELIPMLKMTTQMRTGDIKEQRGARGICVNPRAKSYITFRNGPDSMRGRVFEKGSRTWFLEWVPYELRVRLNKLYKEAIAEGRERLFPFSTHKHQKIHKSWREITEKVAGVNLTYHDLRKVSLTWLYVMGIPLEIATSLNVGWDDLNTARDHYLQLRGLMKRSEREEYQKNIPDWFKEGLEEYMKTRWSDN